MKKVFGIIGLAVAFAACTKNEMDLLTNEQAAEMAGGITITTTLAPKVVGTKAVSESGGKIVVNWAKNEHLAILYEVDGIKKMADAEITAVDGSGTATISFTVDGSTADNTACTIVYPKSAAKGNNTGVKDNETLLGAQDGTLNATLDVRVGEGTILMSTPSLNVTTQPAPKFSIFKFTVKNTDGSAAINAAKLIVTIYSKDYIITPSSPTSELYAALPISYVGRKIQFTAIDESSNVFICSKSDVMFPPGYYYQSTLKMYPLEATGTIDGHEYVAMGDGLLWAACNVGASTPIGFGDYFAWGETATKSNYTWSTYLDSKNGDGVPFMKYSYDVFPPKSRLDPEDDAAHVKWGGSWRMPTPSEWEWLGNNCTWTWTDDYEGTGVSGMIVTSNKEGYTDSSIFLPAAGYKDDTDHFNDCGYYWSSDFCYSASNSTYAYRVYFYSGGKSTDSSMLRYFGIPVRPVSD